MPMLRKPYGFEIRIRLSFAQTIQITGYHE
jgi:hypothetical protein